MEKKDKKLNVKRLKIVSENINNDFELGHNISDNYNGNIVNITINEIPDLETVRTICKKWPEKAGNIYKNIMKQLL